MPEIRTRQYAATAPHLGAGYAATRQLIESLAAPLSEADAAIQSMEDASPAKWHLAHTTWFFETFLLRDHLPGYTLYREDWPFLFNSYYEAEGARVERDRRGMLSRPSLAEILAMDIDFHEQLPWLFPHTDAKSWFEGDVEARKVSAFRNSSLQGGYLIMAARAAGLDCGAMSGFDNKAVDSDFFADQPNWKSNFICSIGYGDRTSLFDRSPRSDFEAFNRVL